MGNLIEEARLALHGMWIRRWVALAAAWVICAIGWLVVSLIPNQYQSSARVAVELRNILPAETMAAGQAESARNLDRVRQALTSAANLQKVVRGTEIGMTIASPADLNARTTALQGIIKVTALPDNLIEISATVPDGALGTADPGKLSQAIVGKMIDIYVDDHLTSQREETGQALQFLDQQIADRQRRLQEAEERRTRFAADYLAALPGSGSLSDRVTAARAQLAQVTSDLAGAQSSLNAVNSQLAAARGSGAAVPVAAGPARARLAAIEGQIAEARARGWTASHPDMVALANQHAAARAAAQNEPLLPGAGGGNPLDLQLRSMQTDRAARVAELSQQEQQLRTQLAQLEAKINDDPDAAAEQAQLDRDIASMKAQYDSLFADREKIRLQAQVQNQTDAVKFRILSGPNLPTTPTSPNRLLLLAGVLMAGLGGGVAAAFALSRLNTTFPTAARLETLSGMPVIGSVGEVVSNAQSVLRRQRFKQFASGLGALGGVFMLLLAAEIVQRGLGA